MSRHYYDLHCMLNSEIGKHALSDPSLGADCARHAHMFFNRPDYDLSSAVAGSFALAPTTEMIEALSRDYDNTTAMIFGKAPEFGDILASITRIEDIANGKLSVDASERDAMPDSVSKAPQ